MLNIYEYLISIWETVAGINNLPDYIDVILYIVTLLFMLLVVFAAPIIAYMIVKLIKNGLGGGYND